VPRPPTLEDVYFEIEARRAAAAGLAPGEGREHAA
jgi:hypothetical protein